MPEIGGFDVEYGEADQLGKGGYGQVFKAKDKTGGAVACKVVSHKKMRLSAINEEVRLMRRLDHKHVIKLHDYVRQEEISYIFMELASAGDLFAYVIALNMVDEPVARRFFGQMLEGLTYLHSVGVAHRDLKLENVLLDEHHHCKICDFGLAHEYQCDAAGKIVHTPLRDVCGSKSYAAPEVLAGRGYDGFAADVWSCGICLFAMLAGFFPFDGATASDWRFTRVVQAVAQGQSLTHTIFGFYSRPCVLSAEAAALIDSMLVIYHTRRLSVVDACASQWISGREKASGRAQTKLKNLNGVGQQHTESPRYRSAHFVEIPADEVAMGLQMSVDLDIEPVYRSLGDVPLSKPSAPPLARQDAFGMLYT